MKNIHCTVFRRPQHRSGYGYSGFAQLFLQRYMSGRTPNTDQYDIKPVHQTSQILKPSTTLTFLEEDILTIDDGHFLYSATVNNWYNIPSWRNPEMPVVNGQNVFLQKRERIRWDPRRGPRGDPPPATRRGPLKRSLNCWGSNFNSKLTPIGSTR